MVSVFQSLAGKQFREFLSPYQDAVLKIVESGTIFSREEIEPLLNTTLPGMAEVAGLLAIQRLLESGRHDHIVVDTAPFGHTLRLFELPGHFQRFLDFLEVASSRDALLARRFGGRVTTPAHAFLQRWQATVDQVKAGWALRTLPPGPIGVGVPKPATVKSRGLLQGPAAVLVLSIALTHQR